MFKKTEQPKFERYTDPTGEFTNTRLKFSEWYVTHKILLRKIFIWVLAVWSAVTISIGLFVWGKYLIFDYTQDEQNIASIVTDYVSDAHVARQSAQDLSIGNQWVFNSAEDKYDFAVEVTNPNERWSADISYTFSYNSRQTEVRTTRILPGQTRFVVFFGEESPRRPSGAAFDILDTTWARINPHDVFDPVLFMSQRLLFHTDEISFIPSNRVGGTDSHQISFDVYNDSLFSYWDASFIAIYKRNGRITGMTPLLLQEFLAGESRRIEHNSYMDNLDLDDVELQPMIDVFDQSVYMPI